MRKILSLMLGLGLGAGIGVLIVMLFAPTSGEQLVANLKAGWEETLAAARLASIDARLVTLGTDGFGRSDTRAQLRRYFEVDARAIVAAGLEALRT